jgi:hypothetical protein
MKLPWHNLRYPRFLVSITSRRTLEPTQALIQRVPGALSANVNGRGVNLTTDLHLVLRLRMDEAIPPLPHVCYGVVLN